MNILRKLTLILPLITSVAAQQAIDVVTVVSRPVERTVRLPGEFWPYLKADLYARVNGFVEDVKVDRGSIVKEGELLAVLSAPELIAQRMESESKAQAAESQRAEAQAKLLSEQSTYERMKSAAETPGAIAVNELIVAEKTVEAARAAVKAGEDSVRAAQAAVNALRELEGYLRVTAPFDGVITERLVHPGALVGPAAGASPPLLRIEQNSVLRLVVAVPESEVGGIVRGAHVPFSVPAYPGVVFSGTVSRIAHAVEVKTRTMPVELDVRNPNRQLAPGMYPEVQWPVRSPQPVLLVPPSSIVTTTESTFVIRVRDGRAEYVPVSRGAPAGDLVRVVGQLSPGDEIVRRGSDEIREGTVLNVRRQPPQPQTAQTSRAQGRVQAR